MADFTSLLEELPPGADLYEFLVKTVDELVYPDLGRPFYVQAFVAVGLCGLVILAIAVGLITRWHKGRLSFLLADGTATRPNPRVVVPILWLINGICYIIHAFLLRSASLSHHLSYNFGVYWWMMSAGLTCSYAVISISVVCTAPAVRKALNHMNSGRFRDKTSPAFLLVHGSLLGVCILAVAPTYAAGRLTGQSFALAHQGYAGIQALIAQAREEQNPALLSTVGIYTDMLVLSQERNKKGMIVGGAIYSTHIILFFLIGLIPACFLNAYVRKRVGSLDSGLGTSGPSHSETFQATSRRDIPVSFKTGASNHVDISVEGGNRLLPMIDLPKDRPFANLTSTSILPVAYASILKCQMDPKEKARKLRKALRRDNLQLLAYFILLAFMGSLAFFQAAQGPAKWDSRLQLTGNQMWQVWSYILPALLLAGAFLYDAISNNGSEDEVIDAQVATFRQRGFQAPPLASIQLSQTVEVVEEHQLQEKSSVYKAYA